MNDPYIAILHGNDEEPHDPIVTTVEGGTHVERDMGIRIVRPCEHCGRESVTFKRRIGRYDFTESHPAPEPFKRIVVARLTSVSES